MATRTKSNRVYTPVYQYSHSYNPVKVYTSGMNAAGYLQSINQTGSQIVTDNLGRQRKLTAVVIRKVEVKQKLQKSEIRFGTQGIAGYCMGNHEDSWYTLYGNITGVAQWPHIQSLRNQAAVRAFSKLDRAEVGGGENAATIRETIRMLKAPLASVVRLGHEMVHQSRKRVQSTRDTVRYYRKLGDALADQWLQYRYGIMPLVYDAQGLIQILDSKLWEWENRLKTVRATACFEESKARVTTGSFGYLGRSTASGIETCRHKCTVIVYYVDKLHMKDAITLEQLGLSPTQWPSLAWELLPFSFIADWGFNVGDWLKAVSPHPTLTVKSSSTSYKREVVRSMEKASVYWAGAPSYVATVPGYLHKVTELERTFGASLPVSPGLTTGGYSFKRKIDSLALTWSMWPSVIGLFKSDKVPFKRNLA